MSAAFRILTGLVAGLSLGAILASTGVSLDDALGAAAAVGGLWLDALRMTVIPLVVSLVVTGISAAASTAKAGGVTRRAIALFVILLAASALVGASLGSLLLGAWSPSAAALESFRSGLSLADAPAIPPAAEWFRTLIPSNVVAAAAEGQVVPLTIFALLLGLALARLPQASATPLLAVFRGLADAMLLIVQWILLLAPIGVFALAFGVGAKIGLGAGAVLAHYVSVQIIVTVVLGLAMYPLAIFAGRTGAGPFARAALPVQAVAASTQSSLASLPPMLAAAARLGVPHTTSSIVLPLAVALFRIAAPASIVIVAFAMAAISGVELGAAQIAIIVALATLNTLVIAGLPNQVTFFAAYAPPAMAAGIPIELLPLLLAVDTIPDIFYTTTNVTADLAVGSVVGRKGIEEAEIDTVVQHPADKDAQAAIG